MAGAAATGAPKERVGQGTGKRVDDDEASGTPADASSPADPP